MRYLCNLVQAKLISTFNHCSGMCVETTICEESELVLIFIYSLFKYIFLKFRGRGVYDSFKNLTQTNWTLNCYLGKSMNSTKDDMMMKIIINIGGFDFGTIKNKINKKIK